MRVCIIGAGITGLSLAEKLSAQGCQVTVLEAAPFLGGLATWQDYGSFVWDRFYHVILPSDRYLISFIEHLGLRQQLQWRPTRTGYFVEGRMYSMSSNLDFAKFPLLSLFSKVRLAIMVLYCSKIFDWRPLERVSVEDWLVRVCGRKVYEQFWRPLLLAKLGEHYRRVSAVFIWTYVKRLFSARDPAVQRERLGYVSGGYRTIISRIVDRIVENGGTVQTGYAVRAIRGKEQQIEIEGVQGTKAVYDKVIFTGPMDALRAVAAPELAQLQVAGNVEYLGVICGVIQTRKMLAGYYVINIADDRVPFTGVVDMSSLVDNSETAGRFLTYLPRYLLSNDIEFEQSDDVIRQRFRAGLRVMFPELEDDDILQFDVFRARKVQPLQVVGYSQLAPKATTRHPGFFIVNTAQFASNTLNNNEVIRNVEEFLKAHQTLFAPQ